MTTATNQAPESYSVAIIETVVLGAAAYTASCRHCVWRSKAFEREVSAIRSAKKHGAWHVDPDTKTALELLDGRSP